MEEPKERPNELEMSNSKNTKHLDVHNVASPTQQIKKDIAEKLYHVLSFYESSIIQDIDKCKKDEIRIINVIKWFSSSDKRREWEKQHIKNVEKDLEEVDHELAAVDHELTMTSVPRTDIGFFRVSKKDRYWSESTPIDIGTDKKRCHNRLNKGRMDLEYAKQVQEELLIYKEADKMPTDGAQELNYVMESLVHRIQHGNNNRAEEAKLYHEIRNVNDTIEMYTAPDPDPLGRFSIWRKPKPDKQYRQHQLKIVSNQLEKAHTIRKGQVIHELDLLRTKIKCMERKLEKISSLTKKAYKCAYKYGEQQNEVKSSYTEYQPLMKHVKELARRGDIEELMQVCHMQLFEGCSKF